MTELSVQHEVVKKELQLNALLEITQAINYNVSEISLYKIFNFTLRSNLRIAKVALFVLDERWNCKIGFGTTHNFQEVALPHRYKQLEKTQPIAPHDDDDFFDEFDLVIPVAHKHETLALVFIGNAAKDPLDEEELKFVQAISNIIVVAIENKKMARKQLQQEAFRKELEIAGDVQQLLFPAKLPHTDTLDVEASYLPHDLVGGDYYDYISISDDQFLVCIADVSGKGVPAAIMMSNFQAALQTLLRKTIDLKEIVEELNYLIFKSTKGENFITFFGAMYNTTSQTMEYINSGHNPPALYTGEQPAQLLDKGSTVLGAIHPLPFLHKGRITNLNEFLLCMYTDGVTETINESDEEFGAERLLHYLSAQRHKNLKGIHQDIILMLDEFKGTNGYQDDITILSCRVSNNK